MFFKSKNVKIKELEERVTFMENLCEEKDSFFKELISDGLRRKSPLAAKHMVDRREHLRGRK